jgi:hypothetical protein
MGHGVDQFEVGHADDLHEKGKREIRTHEHTDTPAANAAGRERRAERRPASSRG